MIGRAAFLLLLTALMACAQGRNTPRGEAGSFDFYVLSASWSPQYCSSPAGERDRMQCAGGRKYAFILHGLWPQYERGWPQFCGQGRGLDNALVERMLDIMPSRGLVRHEWEKHGTCAGLSPEAYFAKARAAFGALRIPSPLQSPAGARTVTADRIQGEFVAANGGMPHDAMTVHCAGRFLSEVRVCLTREGKPRPCPQAMRRQACRVPEIIVQPVR